MHVIETEDKINEKLVPKVGTKGHSNDKKNWRRDGWVILNGGGGEGVDIFFSLEMANGSGSVVITDQRKRDTKALGASKLNKLVESARITPSTVVCLFSCLSSTHLRPEDIPNDSCVVSYAQTRAYHGSLWVHPASSPCVNLNLDSIISLKMVFKGQDAEKFCREILKKRLKGKFRTMEEVEKFISAKKKKLEFNVSEDDMGRIIL